MLPRFWVPLSLPVPNFEYYIELRILFTTRLTRNIKMRKIPETLKMRVTHDTNHPREFKLNM